MLRLIAGDNVVIELLPGTMVKLQLFASATLTPPSKMANWSTMVWRRRNETGISRHGLNYIRHLRIRCRGAKTTLNTTRLRRSHDIDRADDKVMIL